MDVHKESVNIVAYKGDEERPSINVEKKNREYELRKYFTKLKENC